MQMRAPWTPRPENDSEKVREVSFTLSLTAPMGPKHSAVIETQVKHGILFEKMFWSTVRKKISIGRESFLQIRS
jgi:hypothetical protein